MSSQDMEKKDDERPSCQKKEIVKEPEWFFVNMVRDEWIGPTKLSSKSKQIV